MEIMKVLENLKVEDLTFLKNLANELKTQDNCATATPLIFKIRETNIVAGMDTDIVDDICIVDCEGNLFTEPSELIEFIEDNYSEEDDDNINSIVNRAGFEEDELDLNDFNDLHKLLEELGSDGWTVTGYVEEYIYKGEFLTRESALQHLECNRHHYKKDAVVYATHGWRNPTLEKLLDIVKKFD